MEQSFLDWRTYDYTEIRYILNQIKGSQLIKTNKKIEYYNIPCAFDIETTSFLRKSGKEEEKGAIMYEWTLGLNGYVIVGRKWEEFIYVLNATIEELELWENKRLIIYVHNLSFEFQFMRKWIKWKNVFSLDVRKPVYACTEGSRARGALLPFLPGFSKSSVRPPMRVMSETVLFSGHGVVSCLRSSAPSYDARLPGA